MRCCTVVLSAIVLSLLSVNLVFAQHVNDNVPLIPYMSIQNFLKYSPEMNLGETLAVAVNSNRGVFANSVVRFPSTICSKGLIEGLAFLIEFYQLEVTANCVIKGNSVP